MASETPAPGVGGERVTKKGPPVLSEYLDRALAHVPKSELDARPDFRDKVNWINKDLAYKDTRQQQEGYLWATHCGILARFVRDRRNGEADTAAWEDAFWATLTPWRTAEQ